MREQKRSFTMRVCPDTSQEAIERAASEEWKMEVRFGMRFPSILEANGSYLMKKFVEPADDEDTPPTPDIEEETSGLKAIVHRPLAVSYTKSGSVDDLRALAADDPPKTNFMAMWVIKFGPRVTQIMAPENTPIDEICDRAAVDLGLELKKWLVVVERRAGRISILCTSPDPHHVPASIHLGNQERAGKVI
jgi:hypothetical protein